MINKIIKLKVNGFGAVDNYMKYNKSWTLKKVLQLAKNYKNDNHKLSCFKREQRSAYNWAWRNGYYLRLQKIIGLKISKKKYWRLKEIRDSAKMFSTKAGFKVGDRKNYERALKLGLLELVCNHCNSPKRISNGDLIQEAKKFNYRGEMANLSESAYRLILRRKLTKQAFSHMAPVRERNEEIFHKNLLTKLRKTFPGSIVSSEVWISKKSKVDLVFSYKDKIYLIELKSELSRHYHHKSACLRQLARYQEEAADSVKNFKDVFLVSENGKLEGSISVKELINTFKKC